MTKKSKPRKSRSSTSDQVDGAREDIPNLLRNLDLTYLDQDKEPERLDRLKVIADNLPDDLVVGLANRLRQEFDLNAHSPEQFFESYQISPAEADLLKSLANGITVTEHAKVKNVSVNTVRTQIRSLLGKTNASNQTDLVRIYLSHRTFQHTEK